MHLWHYLTPLVGADQQTLQQSGMANEFYRNRLINNIKHAVQEARDAAKVNHPGLQGRIRELAAGSILKPLLLAGFEIGNGKITDQEGGQSSEIDIIIHNKAILPAILYSPSDGLYPIEACYQAVEIKTRASAANVRDAIEKGRSVHALTFAGKENAPSANVCPAASLLFAFDTDLKAGSSELERYSTLDPDWAVDPVLKAICVVGSGYWYFSIERTGWWFHPPTPEFDEVIDFVSGVVNQSAINPPFLRLSRLGYYLMLERQGLLQVGPNHPLAQNAQPA